MGWIVKLLSRLFRRSRHKVRRDEDLQGRPARPEVEANVAAIMAHCYMDRTKSRPTRKSPGFKNYRFGHRGGRIGASGFGNPRWMRAEGVTPFGLSSDGYRA